MPISSTFQQRFGFNDPELTSPAHDDLVLWIGEHAEEWVRSRSDLAGDIREAQELAKEACRLESVNQRRIAEAEIAKRGRNEFNGHVIAEAEERAALYAELAGRDPDIPKPTAAPAVKTLFEVPVQTGRGYIIGFLDAVTTTTEYQISVDNVDWFGTEEDKQARGMCGRPCLRIHPYTKHYGFEAKPQIRSLGELLRQLRAYQQVYWPCKTHPGPTAPFFTVVSPDTRFRDTILAQGFGFWESPR